MNQQTYEEYLIRLMDRSIRFFELLIDCDLKFEDDHLDAVVIAGRLRGRLDELCRCLSPAVSPNGKKQPINPYGDLILQVRNLKLTSYLQWFKERSKNQFDQLIQLDLNFEEDRHEALSTAKKVRSGMNELIRNHFWGEWQQNQQVEPSNRLFSPFISSKYKKVLSMVKQRTRNSFDQLLEFNLKSSGDKEKALVHVKKIKFEMDNLCIELFVGVPEDGAQNNFTKNPEPAKIRGTIEKPKEFWTEVKATIVTGIDQMMKLNILYLKDIQNALEINFNIQDKINEICRKITLGQGIKNAKMPESEPPDLNQQINNRNFIRFLIELRNVINIEITKLLTDIYLERNHRDPLVFLKNMRIKSDHPSRFLWSKLLIYEKRKILFGEIRSR